MESVEQQIITHCMYEVHRTATSQRENLQKLVAAGVIFPTSVKAIMVSAVRRLYEIAVLMSESEDAALEAGIEAHGVLNTETELDKMTRLLTELIGEDEQEDKQSDEPTWRFA